jgi:hypothetical protein
METMHFEHVKVLPFVGENYKRKMPWGLPVMVVGESHYSEEALDTEFTIRVVNEMLDGSWKRWMNVFARTQGSFETSSSNRESRRLFWSSAVFYNFIQETVGVHPRIRPTETMWGNARPAFEEVLIEHQPGFVLVLGNQLWANLPVPIELGLVALPDRQPKQSRLYFNGAGHAFTFGIAHPSSPGWSYREWRPWVQSALQEAVKFQKVQSRRR